MSEKQPDATRIFSLLRKLSKDGRQSAEETHELVEFIKTMAASNVIERLESKIDAVNTKYTVLIWAIGFASVIISAAIIFSGQIYLGEWGSSRYESP